MGLIIQTDDKPVTVFAKEKTWSGGSFMAYSVGISSKDRDGNWVNGYIDVQFKKGIDVENKSKINIKKAFPIVSKSGDRAYVKWMIMDFDVVEGGEPSAPKDEFGFAPIPEGAEDLPFAPPTR